MVSRKARARRALLRRVCCYQRGARRTLRFTIEEGGVEAQRALATALSRAVVRVSLD